MNTHRRTDMPDCDCSPPRPRLVAPAKLEFLLFMVAPVARRVVRYVLAPIRGRQIGARE